ncbi:MAG TPA: type II toxin-antitoxin system RatA family toxin [Hyphomicrobiaceae bacterium]|nr:type II toxin-antitoxin system RatA family toxin [Hyphomicrobiaceae bacterium]
MPQFTSQRTVPFTARQMYDLVADIGAYPEFLPLCEALQIRSHETAPDGKPVAIADMVVGYKTLRETFTTRVTLDEPGGKILVEYLDGPFQYLENVWTFKDAPAGGAGSTVDFYIAYEFKSAILGLVMGGLFDKAFRTFAEAFEARAREMYGDDVNTAAAGGHGPGHPAQSA